MSPSAGITEFRNKHEGEEVAILLNGLSLIENLPYLPKYTIGVNASAYHHKSQYHVALDILTLWKMCNPEYKQRPDLIFSHRVYYTDGRELTRPPIFNYVDFEPITSAGWSEDLSKGIYTGRVSLWVALQVAVYMGFDPIYLVGFDLKGGHIPGHINEGHDMMSYSARKQLYLMRRVVNYYRPKGIIKAKVYNCSPDSECKSLPYFNLKDR